MTEDEALRDIRGYAAAGRIMYTSHARKRMSSRGAGPAHVKAALSAARDCIAAEEGRWKVTGPDLDDDDLTCVVALEGGVIVVTVF